MTRVDPLDAKGTIIHEKSTVYFIPVHWDYEFIWKRLAFNHLDSR